MLRMCKNCRSPFRPHIKVPGQKYCSKRECQKARRKHWQKIKLQEDDDYKKNKASAQKNWASKNPQYWKDYRKNHSGYVERNNALQKKRNLRSRGCSFHAQSKADVIAKMDELTQPFRLVSGYYVLVPVAVEKIAKMDEMLVRIEIITKA